MIHTSELSMLDSNSLAFGASLFGLEKVCSQDFILFVCKDKKKINNQGLKKYIY